MNDKVNELVLVHLFGVEVGHEKTDVVALEENERKTLSLFTIVFSTKAWRLQALLPRPVFCEER